MNMPSWLVDDPVNVLTVLALLALGLGVIWWIRRGEDYGKKKLTWLKGLKARRLTLNQCCAMGLACLGFLGVVVLLLYFFVDSDDKRIRRAIKEMSAGVKEQNVDKIFAHVSERFSLMGQGKSSYRSAVERHIRNGDITDISVWDFDQAKLSEDVKGGKTIEFTVKPKGTISQGVFYRCLATFVRDSDGQWRLQTFVVSMPHIDPASKRQIIYPP
jgi:hypothetical protein